MEKLHQEEIIKSSLMFYYLLQEGMDVTNRRLVVLKDEVDGKALRHAVDRAARRYPYLCRRLKATETDMVLTINEEPLIVAEGVQDLLLNSPETNYHLLAVSYTGRRITFHAFHGLVDGTALMRFVRTVLLCYCREVYDPALPAGKIWEADQPVDPAEWENPMDKPLPPHDMPLCQPRMPEKVFRFVDDPRVQPGAGLTHRLRIPSDDLMRFCRSHDGSPNVAVSLLLSRAITAVRPAGDSEIVGVVYNNIRPALGAPLSHHSLISEIRMVFDEALRRQDFARQCTACRGRLFLQNGRDFILDAQEQKVAGFAQLRQIPDLRSRVKAFAAQAIPQCNSFTYQVSYAGPAELEACQPYVDMLYTDLPPSMTNIMVEIAALQDDFFISFLQGFSSDVYYRAFLQELESAGVRYTEISKEDFPQHCCAAAVCE